MNAKQKALEARAIRGDLGAMSELETVYRSQDNYRAEVLRAMQTIPMLTDFGLGIFSTRDKTSEQVGDEMATKRNSLLEHSPLVKRVAAWLREHIRRIRTINRRRTSYGLKHLVEAELGYVSNGELIAAAVIEGYSWAHVDRYEQGPNLYFSMSERSLKLAERRLRRKGRPIL